jgi:Cu+-exporting ATPase
MLKDPVCGMVVDTKSAYLSAQAGQVYLFCNPTCKTKFDQQPERYTAPTGGRAELGGRP